jgi:hypothetical protein
MASLRNGPFNNTTQVDLSGRWGFCQIRRWDRERNFLTILRLRLEVGILYVKRRYVIGKRFVSQDEYFIFFTLHFCDIASTVNQELYVEIKVASILLYLIFISSFIAQKLQEDIFISVVRMA